MRNCLEMLEQRWAGGFYLCVDLKPDIKKIPNGVTGGLVNLIGWHNRVVTEATRHVAAAYLLDMSTYLSHGAAGMQALEHTCTILRVMAPGVPIILRGDFAGDATEAAQLAYNTCEVDAVTANPYAGREALAALFHPDKLVFVQCHTGGPGTHDFQDVMGSHDGALYWRVADLFSETGSLTAKNSGLVSSALCPAAIRHIRRTAPSLPLLITDIEERPAALDEVVRLSRLASMRRGTLISASASIVYAAAIEGVEGPEYWLSGPRAAAEKLHATIADAIMSAIKV